MIFDATTDNGIDRVCLAFLAFGFLPPAIGKAQVDPTILLVVRMDGDLHETALTVLNHLSGAYDRLRVEFAIGGNETQGASIFSHKLAAIWQKGDGPGLFKAFFDYSLDLITGAIGRGELASLRPRK